MDSKIPAEVLAARCVFCADLPSYYFSFLRAPCLASHFLNHPPFTRFPPITTAQGEAEGALWQR